MASTAGQKRKINYGHPDDARWKKRQKSRDARDIPAQTADAALSTTGELNIASFIKAREFEIDALDKSMRKSRKGLMSRAFQQVPRSMRRRTASHNVKKVPRRLRGRAAREMKEDNTPTVNSATRKPSGKLRLRLETAKALRKLNKNRKTVRLKKREAKANAKEPDPAKHVSISRVPKLKKNNLALPPTATTKYKRRQVAKTWLPTHLWHTKRAHMTRPTLPLWRMALPLTPTEKSYRPSHRAADIRGCIAWDTSYISTVGCWGTAAAVVSLLKSLGFHGEGWSGPKYNRWRSGCRFAEGWVCQRDNQKRPLAPVHIVWQCQSQQSEQLADTNASPSEPMDIDQQHVDQDQTSKPKKKARLDSRILIRVHPSAFHTFWLELLKVAKMQKPQVLVEDLRFEIGSITIEGPSSSETLVGVLKPITSSTTFTSQWTQLAGVANPSSLPQNSILAFDTVDPRLYHPPEKVTVDHSTEGTNRLNELVVSWPFDSSTTNAGIFDHKTRYVASSHLPSQKAIDRRKQKTQPGRPIPPFTRDVAIPVMLLAHRSQGVPSQAQGSWTLLLPWSCVDPVWRSIMYYPLSSGGTPRFGGLQEVQQLAFEKCSAWFPGDFPGTSAGKAWEKTESEKRFDAWVARPPSRRLPWDQLDLGLDRRGEVGRGWACDWENLFRGPDTAKRVERKQQELESAIIADPSAQLRTQRQRKEALRAAELKREAEAQKRNTSSPESEAEDVNIHNDVEFSQLAPSEARAILLSHNDPSLPSHPVLATIRIRLLNRGTPKPAARIYRLPQRAAQPSGASLEAEKQPIEPTKQAQPILFSPTPSYTNKRSLRERWLALDPNPTSQLSNPNSSTDMPKALKTLPRNRHGDPREHRQYAGRADLSHVRVFPRDAPEKIKNMFGPPRPKQSREELLRELIPQVVKPGTEDEPLWERHVPCPDECDLVGFVTSGSYNLVEGGGTAIGAVWVQRVIEGWQPDDQTKEKHGSDTAKREEKRPDRGACRAEKQKTRKVARERHLCVVRNAGESIGRLGLWEVC